MPVTALAFREWLDEAKFPSSMSRLAADLELNRSALRPQFSANRVKETTLVTAFRVAGRDPVTELAKFDGYQALSTDVKPPTEAEVLSQLSHADVWTELLSRSHPRYLEALQGVNECAPLPLAGGTRAWIEAIDPGDIRRDLVRTVDTTLTYLSTQIVADRLPPATAVEAARLAGVSPVSGLLVVGLITLDEAAWPPQIRENTLRALPELRLIELAQLHVTNLRRIANKNAETESTTNRFWENLG